MVSGMDSTAFPRQLARTGRFWHGIPRGVTVSADGSRVLFVRSAGGADPVNRLWAYDNGAERLLADPTTLPDDTPGEVPPEERARRERARERSSGVAAFAADADCRTAVFALDGRLWAVDADGGTPRPLPSAGAVVDPRPDPTGARVAYVSAGALRVVGVDGVADRTLATPEGPGVSWGLAEHVAAESMHRLRGHWWAPDGSRLLAARVDESGVGRWWIADPAHPDRPPRSMAYPVAGTPNAEVSLWLFDLEGGRTEVVWDRAGFEYLVDVAWDAHGPLLTVQSRDQGTLRVLTADPATGVTSLLHEQCDPAWVQIVPGTPARTASGVLVHTLDDGDTRRLTVGGEPVTPRGLQVREVLGVEGERVLFTASDEPTETHVWWYGPGAGVVRVSTEPGVHTARRGGSVLVLDSRTEDGHTMTVLRNGGPGGRIASLAEKPVLRPRITWLRAGEREIRAALLLPSWYEPGSGPLPVLLDPYGGHGMQLAVRSGGWWMAESQWFAEAGFAVLVADGRGTPGRGPAWEKAFHGDKLTPALEDQIVALRAAAEHHRDLDLGRVAMRGWSYSGFLAAAAVLREPEIFHAAVAGAAPFDARLYDTHWQERFLGDPGEHPDRYDRCSLIADAPALRRPLLLVHGLADDNVTVANTLRMSSALLAAGRPHSVLPLSSSTHSGAREEEVLGLLTHQREFLRDALGMIDPAGR